MEPDSRVKLAIVGGGIGGLAIALALSKLAPDYGRYYQVDIFESTASLQAQVGAGIGVWPRTWRVLEALGIDKELLKYTEGDVVEGPVETFMFRQADEEQGGKDLFTVWTGAGSLLFFHRGDFQAVLLRNLPPSVTVHTNKRLNSCCPTANNICLSFQDGTFYDADLVVGADGLQSRVRRSLLVELAVRAHLVPGIPPSLHTPTRFPDLKNSFAEGNKLPFHPADPVWTGRVAYRSLIDRQKLLDAGWKDHRVFKGGIHYLGENGFIIAFPVSNGAKVNVAAYRIWHDHENSVYKDDIVDNLLKEEAEEKGLTDLLNSLQPLPPAQGAMPSRKGEASDPWAENGGGGRISAGRARWVSRVSREQVKLAFAGWEPEVQVLINSMTSALRWAVHAVRPLQTFVSGRVCVIGDAAHAMHPHQGAGAGQSIDDAYVLGSLLASAINVSSGTTGLRSIVPKILETYDTIRRPSAQAVAAKSRSHAFLFTYRLPHKDKWRSVDRNNDSEMLEVERRMNSDWEWTWDKDGAMGEAREAVQILQGASL